MTLKKSIKNTTYDRDYFHGIGSCYPKSGYETGKYEYQKRPVRFILRKKGPGVKWLDVGCAYGILVNFALANGIDAYGVDVSEYAIREGKKLFPKISDRLFVCDCDGVLKLFSRECFDVVSMIEIVEHLPNPKKSLTIVSQILKKGGFMIIKTPIPANPNKERDVTHISVKPINYWASILRELGYKVKAPYFPDEPKYFHGWIAECWRLVLAQAHKMKYKDVWILAKKV